MGVSVENQQAQERLYDLGRTPAAVRFISYEPAIESVNFRLPHLALNCGLPNPDWIIIGGESGPNARPFDLQWARDTIELCKLGRIACFVKQLGAKPIVAPLHSLGKTSDGRYVVGACQGINGNYITLLLDDPKGGDMSEWPSDLCVRNFPEVHTHA
jgi:protein gp37